LNEAHIAENEARNAEIQRVIDVSQGLEVELNKKNAEIAAIRRERDLLSRARRDEPSPRREPAPIRRRTDREPAPIRREARREPAPFDRSGARREPTPIRRDVRRERSPLRRREVRDRSRTPSREREPARERDPIRRARTPERRTSDPIRRARTPERDPVRAREPSRRVATPPSVFVSEESVDENDVRMEKVLEECI
jgi:hypothetical protein